MQRLAFDSDDDDDDSSQAAPMLDIDKIVEHIVRSENAAAQKPRKSIVHRVKTTASDIRRSFRRSRSTAEHKRLAKYE